MIERAAELHPEDVALEIGGGLGVLSEHLAPLVAHLHVVEVDRRLEPALRDALDPFDNATLHFADAMDLDLPQLAPSPTRVVANLPYGIAASVVLRTIEQLGGVERWVVMVQREVGERLAARPGSSAYGAPSVLAQLACEVRVLRLVSRSVFVPAPRVDSVLVTLSRTGPAPAPAVRELVRAGFAHRRKAMATSLAQAPAGQRPTSSPRVRERERVREALVALGHPAAERAERLAPEEFVALARLLAEPAPGDGEPG